ncbi:MAG TPA: hypothetical protein VJI15_05305 [Candidatus Nanoarchaeia archaeon]|nr:hypothetical protein [Candidatus Nanoarchaeia archaeon]
MLKRKLFGELLISKKRLFEKISSFYEEGRANLEERVSRVISLEAAREIISDERIYGTFGLHKPGDTDEERLRATLRAIDRSLLQKFRFLYDTLEMIDPLESYANRYYPRTFRDNQFFPKYDGPIPETPFEELPKNIQRAIQSHREHERIYRRSAEDADWKVLRELHEGVVEHGFGRSFDEQRIVKSRNGQEYNLGYHFYRVRRTSDPTGTVVELGLPELHIFGEAQPSFLDRILDRNSTRILGGVPMIGGVLGGIVAAVAPAYFPENADPILYVADALMGLGSAAAIVQGVKKLRE